MRNFFDRAKAYHTHVSESGLIVKCYHKGISGGKMIALQLVITTISFPWEHGLYTYVEPFKSISVWLGLDH